MKQANAAPWELSFSFGRALRASALQVWAGQSENIAAAQKALRHHARCNGAAPFGTYSQAMESP
jgi:fructose-bisphosphate aldolase, class I